MVHVPMAPEEAEESNKDDIFPNSSYTVKYNFIIGKATKTS